MLIASLACIALLAIGLAHLIWSFGGSWPIRDKTLLAHTVIGEPGIDRVPRWRAAFVALLALAGSVLVLALADHTGGGWSLSVIGAVLGAVFLARGIYGYTAAWKAKTSLEPFRSYDRKVYSPLSLLLGLGFFALVLMRLL